MIEKTKVCDILITTLAQSQYVFNIYAVPDWRVVFSNTEGAVGRLASEAFDEWETSVLPLLEELLESKKPHIYRDHMFKIGGRTTYWDGLAVPYLEDGKVRFISSLRVDVTERKEAEDALRESEERYRTVADFTYDWEYWLSPEGDLLYISPFISRITGYPMETFTDAKSMLKIAHPDDRMEVASHVDHLPSFPETASMDFRIVRKDGEVRWMNHYCRAVWSKDGRYLGRRASNRDVTERREAEMLSNALNRINRTINSTLDSEEIMRRVVTEATEAVGAESGIIALFEGPDLVARYVEGLPESIVGMRNLFPFLKDNRPMLINEPNTPPAKKYGIRSIMIVPLTVRGETIGTFQCNYHRRPVPFTKAQTDFAEGLGTALSLSLENARLFEAELAARATIERNYELLREALVPAKPRMDERYITAAIYLPAVHDGVEIGGDFYDIFNTQSGKIGILIGDVSGKGVEAASLATATRSTVRAYAYNLEYPGEALTRANTIICTQETCAESGRFITIVLAILDPATGEISYSSAGHPPPAILSGGGVYFLTHGNPPLGIVERYDYEETSLTLLPKDKLVLYTDGIQEARYGVRLFDITGIRQALAKETDAHPGQIVQSLLSAATEWARGHLTDDIAIIAVERK
ncbi:MAG: SpoIIE family protein phosphatase [Armatimonadota bacterium]